MKVSHSAGVMWVSSAYLAVIKLLLEENGRKKRRRKQFRVIQKLGEKEIEGMSIKCFRNGKIVVCLKL